jgi:hypothetical protein
VRRTITGSGLPQGGQRERRKSRTILQALDTGLSAFGEAARLLVGAWPSRPAAAKFTPIWQPLNTAKAAARALCLPNKAGTVECRTKMPASNFGSEKVSVASRLGPWDRNDHPENANRQPREGLRNLGTWAAIKRAGKFPALCFFSSLFGPRVDDVDVEGPAESAIMTSPAPKRSADAVWLPLVGLGIRCEPHSPNEVAESLV